MEYICEFPSIPGINCYPKSRNKLGPYVKHITLTSNQFLLSLFFTRIKTEFVDVTGQSAEQSRSFTSLHSYREKCPY